VARQRWPAAARAAAASADLRDRARIAPWPLIREYHDASVQAARDHLGIRAEAVAADAAVADPWTVVEEVLASLDARAPAHI
jgi:hypothetical protein